VCFEPDQTREHDGICPRCAKPLTIGVAHRVAELADRPAGYRPDGAPGFTNLVQLPQIIGEILDVGPKSKRVDGEVSRLVAGLGPELGILCNVPIADISAAGGSLLAEAITRLRADAVRREPGYDGEYGTIRLFQPGELNRSAVLFDIERPAPAAGRAQRAAAPVPLPPVPQPRRPGYGASQKSGASREPAAGQQPEAGLNLDPSQNLVGHEHLDASPSAGLRGSHATEQLAGLNPDQRAAAPDISSSAGLSHSQATEQLAGLDPDQRAAARAASPLLIIAGPGTGKTRTLTYRIASQLAEDGAAAGSCLALTFTRRAAEELRSRLAVLLPAEAGQVTVTTFHGLGLMILREQHERAGLAAGFGVADDAQRLQIAVQLAGSARGGRRLLADADTDPAVRERLAQAMAAAALVDFAGLIERPAALLEADSGLTGALRARWPRISVDEYQDLDAAQYRLLRLLAGDGRGLTAIGDPDQAIYGFRGADVEFFLRFGTDFPGAATRQLTRNYRSSRPIVAGALQAIAPATLVPGRKLETTARGAAISFHQAADEHAEAAWIARSIDQLLGGASFHALDSGRADAHGHDGLSLADVAVLYRTDAQAAVLGQELTRAGLPFQKRSHDALDRRAGVPAIVAEMRLAAAGPARPDKSQPGAARSAPARSDTAGPDGASPGPDGASPGPDGTSPSPDGPGETRSADGSGVVARLRQAVRALTARLPAPRAAGGRAGIVDVLAAGEVLMPLARRCGDDLDRFFTEISLGAQADAIDPRADAVLLLTMHAAKGLEFDVVFLAGCERDLLPLWLPGQDGAIDLAAERRLLFVGMTRARTRLFLACAARRGRTGPPRDTGPSPFLAAIDASLLVRSAPAQRSRPAERQLRLL
jgi:superfamily I DNA/RNA helicase